MNVSVVTLVNDKSLYDKMVCGSIPLDYELIPIYKARSAAQGLNLGIQKASNDLIICCHQDVSFPENFNNTLQEQLKLIGGDFGVVGTFGMGLEYRPSGNIYNPHPKKLAGGVLPCQALSLDEHCLILRRSSGLLFDESYSGFHMYGADICLQAFEKSLTNYIIDSGVNHLSKGKFDKTFDEAVVFFIQKWRDKINLDRFETMCCIVDFKRRRWMGRNNHQRHDFIKRNL